MRILHVTLGFYPALAWGGPVKVVHQNGRELVRRGHEVTVYCSNMLNKTENIRPGTFEEMVDGMRVVYFNTWRFRSWPGTLGPFWLPDLPAWSRREIRNFDVVHLNGYRSSMMLAVKRAADEAGVPVVTQPHGMLPVIMSSFWLKRVYDRFWGKDELEGIAALIALQGVEKQQAIQHHVQERLIELIPNGIDTSERNRFPARGSFRAKFKLDPARPLILFMARINRKKGADMLVEAFAQMRAPDAHLVIAGPDDGQLEEIRRLVHDLGLEDRVTLPGLLLGEDVYAALQDADLFVLPCRSDAFPFAIIESCLAETPVVVTDRCEMSDLVDGIVGDVVPFDARQFAAAMQELLTDRVRYERYRRNCRSMLEESFSIGVVVDRIEALYRRVARRTAREISSHAVA